MLNFFMMMFAYLLGSLSSAVFVCKIFHLPDPRTEGSKNPGTTNVLRIGGKKVAILVLIGDLLKGLIPVLIARYFMPDHIWGWVGLSAVLGHMFPIFFQFKGGKGVATGAGVLLGLSLPLGFLVILTWILVAALFRYSSLAAIIATLLMPFYGFWVARPQILPLVFICVLILIRHYGNIKNLIAGNESKIGKSSERRK
jgi:glycerol-3-phosphate acyltransferase PlsY